MRSEQLREVRDDDVGAVLAQRVGLADPVDADDEAEAAGAPGRDAGEGVLEHGRLAGVDPERLARRRGRCPAPACPAGAAPQRRSRRRAPRRDPRCRRPRARRACSRWTETTARAQSGIAGRPHVAHRAVVDLDSVRPDQRAARARSSGCRARGRSSRRTDRPADPRAARSRARRGTSARRPSAACRRRSSS